MINIKLLKKFIKVFIVVVVLLSFLIPSFDTALYIAATIYQAATMATETTAKRPHGFKIENAEYWDYNENYDKKRIWIDQGGGGSGEGGGAGDEDANNAGNSGFGDEKGGVFGNAAGVGLGGGNAANQSGSGASTSGSGAGGGPGSSGSAMADALRALKEEIAESRAESLARYLETALNASAAKESIAKRESEQESIQKKLVQESIKEKFIKETLATRENLIVAPANYQKSYVSKSETQQNVTAPTANEVLKPQITEKREATIHIVDAVNIIEAKIGNANQAIETIVAPTSEYRETQQTQIAPPEIQYAEIEPGELVAQQQAEERYKQEVESQLAKAIEASKAQETTSDKNDDETEGKGSKGGEDAEADEDKKGDEAQNESQGNAAEKGQFQAETSGKHAGKKVFEIEVNGNLGLQPDRMSHISARKIIVGALSLIFVIGAVIHLKSTKDKKDKKNYF